MAQWQYYLLLREWAVQHLDVLMYRSVVIIIIVVTYKVPLTEAEQHDTEI